MTQTAPSVLQPTGQGGPHPSARMYLMCPPTYFSVDYSINPWMDPRLPVDKARAFQQWASLCQLYGELGHTVHLIDPVPGLPDMVFAANAGTVISGKVLGARFRHQERAPEATAYLSWFRTHYGVVREPLATNEGEGDAVWTGRSLIVGHGFRSDLGAQAELAELFGVPVIGVRLADPRFYHLDTALCVLDADTAAYYPDAFDEAGRAAVAAQFATLIEATERDASVLGLNAVSDGHRVVLPAEALTLAAKLKAHGFEPIGVDMSEFRKAGGGPKCCTLELRA